VTLDRDWRRESATISAILRAERQRIEREMKGGELSMPKVTKKKSAAKQSKPTVKKKAK
jgi:hypothetical protein